MENINRAELIKQYETILDLEKEKKENVPNEENINNKDNTKLKDSNIIFNDNITYK